MRLGLGMGLAYRRRNRLFLLGEDTPAPNFVTFAHTDGSTGAATRTVPISGTAGQLWIGVVHISVGSSTISAPTASGATWNEIFSISHASNSNFKLAAWWKALAGAESNPVFNATNSDEWGAYVFVFNGTDLTTPIGTEFATTNSGSSASPVCPDVVTAGDNRLLLRLAVSVGAIANAGADAPPPNHTQRYRAQLVGAENAQTLGLATIDHLAAGAAGTATWPSLTNNSVVTSRATIALRAAA